MDKQYNNNFKYEDIKLLNLDKHDLIKNQNILNNIFKDYEKIEPSFISANNNIFLYLNNIEIAKVLDVIDINTKIKKFDFEENVLNIYI